MQKQHRTLALLMVMLFSLVSCETKTTREAVQIAGQMSLPEKIGQMLMLGVPEKKNTNASSSIINNYMPGGIILFGFNIGSAKELKKYVHDMQQTAVEKYNIPLFISIDQEGGRVKRIKDGVTQFPGNMAFGVVNNDSMTYDAARITGIELGNLGVNMNLAPAIDVNNNPLNPVINTRSFGSNVKIVTRLGSAYIKGLQKSGCIAVGKHFPGHGDTDKDSHVTLPVIHYDIDRLRKIELPPFIKAIDSGVEAIMTAHISFPKILNDNIPATLSKKFLTDILRGEMHFNGLIITDDMEMNAVSKMMDLGEGAVKSILAGTDMILISTHGKSIEIISQAVRKAVDDGIISENRINESVIRIIELKLRYNFMNSKDGKMTYPASSYSKEETDILKKSVELNSKFSREAIYFYSRNQSTLNLMNNSVNTRIIISSNNFFLNVIENNITTLKNKNYSIFKSENEFLKYIKKKILKENEKADFKNAFVYYQFDKTNYQLIETIVEICREYGLKLNLLCTGNPFALGSVKELPPVLFTFSNTDESLRQLILCLNGKFKPKEKININLGFNEK
ncbi:MAG: beta-N-acetylhexosaminidase [Spirochaetes bacterium]|nr:beta-N-acetylhexosaminidase [Spirochaetota bacterium]